MNEEVKKLKVKKLNENLEQQYIQQGYKLLTKDDVKKLTLNYIFNACGNNYLILTLSENEYTEKELKYIKSKLDIKGSDSTIEIPIFGEYESEEKSVNKIIFDRTDGENIFSDVYFVSHNLRFFFTKECYKQVLNEQQNKVRDMLLNR